MPEELIARRTLLEAAIRIASLPTGAVFFSAWMEAAQGHQHAQGTSAPPQVLTLDEYRPQFFSTADFEALQSFTGLLIPTDETPGAREAHCSEFIDFLLHSMDEYGTDTQKQWRTAMKALQEAGFHAADAAGRASLLAKIAQADQVPAEQVSAKHVQAAQDAAYVAYRLIKRENTFAFYTARAGMIEALDYRGNSYNIEFPACTHPEHHEL